MGWGRVCLGGFPNVQSPILFFRLEGPLKSDIPTRVLKAQKLYKRSHKQICQFVAVQHLAGSSQISLCLVGSCSGDDSTAFPSEAGMGEMWPVKWSAWALVFASIHLWVTKCSTWRYGSEYLTSPSNIAPHFFPRDACKTPPQTARFPLACGPGGLSHLVAPALSRYRSH